MQGHCDDSVWAQPLGACVALQETIEHMIEKQKKAYCSVPNCHYTSSRHPHLAYFRLPTDRLRAAMWLEKIRQVRSKNKKILVCERHFEPRYINRNNEARTRLVMHAVPTLHLPSAAEALQCTPDIAHIDHKDEELRDTKPVICKGTRGKNKKRLQRVTEKRATKLIENFVKRIDQSSVSVHKRMAEIIQLQRRFKRSIHGWKFTDEFKFFALKLYFSCPNTYKVMRSILNLPTISSLYRIYIPSSTNVCDNLITGLNISVQGMTKEQRECAVCIGTLDLKENLHYNVRKDQIIGFYEVDGTQRLEPASRALVVMVRGLYDKWKQAISFSFLSQNRDDEDVRAHILKIMSKMFDIGLSVRVLMSDTETGFFGLTSDRNVNSKVKYIDVNDNKVYFMYDPVHLIKNIRECFITNNFHFNGKIAKWEHVSACYNYESEKHLKLAPKLTSDHITYDPQQSEKDKIKLAAEVFSKATAAAVSTYAEFKVIDEPTDGTVEWIVLINKLYNLLNFTSVNFNDESKIPFSVTGKKNSINQTLTVLKDLRVVDAHKGTDITHNTRFISKLRTTLTALIPLHNELKKIYKKFPSFLSRDCLDTFFDTVQSQHGRLPTCKQLQLAISNTPIFNTFQGNRKKITDNLDRFLAEAIEFSAIVMVYEQVDTEVNARLNAYYESTEAVDFDAVQLSKENPLQELAAYLLYEGYKQHNDCEATRCYAFENTNSTTVILTMKSKNQTDNTVVVMVPTEFVEFIESMELTLKLYFETEYQLNTLTGLRKHLFSGNVKFTMPCQCFPLDYIKCLYLRYRLRLLINYNNEEYESNADQCRKYFVINEL